MGPIWNTSLNVATARLGAPQALLRKTDVDVVLDGTWRSRDFVSGTPALEQKLRLNLSTALRGGWSAVGSVLGERFNCDGV